MKLFKSPWAWVPTLYFAEGVPYVLQAIRAIQHRNNLLHVMAIPSMGHQTPLEPLC